MSPNACPIRVDFAGAFVLIGLYLAVYRRQCGRGDALIAHKWPYYSTATGALPLLLGEDGKNLA